MDQLSLKGTSIDSRSGETNNSSSDKPTPRYTNPKSSNLALSLNGLNDNSLASESSESGIEPDQESTNKPIGSNHELDLGNDEEIVIIHTSRSSDRMRNEVFQFQQAKRASLIQTDPKLWREQLRQHIESELNQQVRAALKTPPRDRLNRLRLAALESETQKLAKKQEQFREIVQQMNVLAQSQNNQRSTTQPDLPNQFVDKHISPIDLRLHPESFKQNVAWHTKHHFLDKKHCGRANCSLNTDIQLPDNCYFDRIRRWKRWFDDGGGQITDDTLIIDSATKHPQLSTKSNEFTAFKSYLKSKTFELGHPPYYVKPLSITRGEFRHCKQMLPQSNLPDSKSSETDDNGEPIGDLFYFEWDMLSEFASVIQETNRFEQLKKLNPSLTGDDHLLLKELCRLNRRHTVQKSITNRTAVMQRLNQLTETEKQFRPIRDSSGTTHSTHFSPIVMSLTRSYDDVGSILPTLLRLMSPKQNETGREVQGKDATRAAYLTASLTQKNKLPDGTYYRKVNASSGQYSFLNVSNWLTKETKKTFIGLSKRHRQESHPSNSETNPNQSQTLAFQDWTGVVRDQHGPFWPSGMGPFFLVPQHRPHLEQQNKSFLMSPIESGRRIPSANLSSYELNKTMKQTTWITSRVVYDSESSPVWADSNCDTDTSDRKYSTKVDIPPGLIFESRFESGNLRQARRIGLFDYELVLQPDLYTKRHVQWFYFAVRNAIPGPIYRFIIVNFSKPNSLYMKGMLPLFHSEKETARTGKIWYRIGQNVRYCRNWTNLSNRLLEPNTAYYQLEWQMEFPHKNDTCYLAYSFPYTFSDLKYDLNRLLETSQSLNLQLGTFDCNILCQTRAGNSCFVVTITDPSIPEEQKQAVVVTARVHPGETNSSWVTLGLLELLSTNGNDAIALRQRFVFYIIPMLNPDGVIVGNYRCSLNGRDLNRNYCHPKKTVFPTVWHTKDLVQWCKTKFKDVIYVDMHGHSCRNNVFMYGCDSIYRKHPNAAGNGPGLDITNDNNTMNLHERLLPYLLSRELPQCFSLSNCRFNIHPNKKSTSRVVFWKEFELTHCFTMEASFNGCDLINTSFKQLETIDFMEVGKTFGRSLLTFHNLISDPNKLNPLLMNMAQEVVNHLILTIQDEIEQEHDEDNKKPDSPHLEPRNKPCVLIDKLKYEDQTQSSDQLRQIYTKSSNLTELTSTIRWLEQVQQQRIGANAGTGEENDVTSSDSNSDSDPELSIADQELLQATLNQVRGLNVIRSQTDLPELDKLDNTDDQENQSTINSQNTKSTQSKKKQKRQKRRTKRERDQIHSITNRMCKQHLEALRANLQHDSYTLLASMDNKVNEENEIRQRAHSNPSTGSTFVSKYAGQTNGGIPCFVEKRLLERACHNLRMIWANTDFTNPQEVHEYRLEENLSTHNETVNQHLLHNLKCVREKTLNHEQLLEGHFQSRQLRNKLRLLGSCHGEIKIPPLPAFMHGLAPSAPNRTRMNSGTNQNMQHMTGPLPDLHARSQSCKLFQRNDHPIPVMQMNTQIRKSRMESSISSSQTILRRLNDVGGHSNKSNPQGGMLTCDILKGLSG